MLVWIDLETTGLDTQRDKILEIAAQATNWNLEPKGSMFHVVVHQEVNLEEIAPAVVDMHTANGLWKEVAESQIDIKQAGKMLISHLTACNIKYDTAMMAGACVHFDRAWLQSSLPDVVDFFNFRILDLDSVKSVIFQWKNLVVLPKKHKGVHRATVDVLDAIEQMREIRRSVFNGA